MPGADLQMTGNAPHVHAYMDPSAHCSGSHSCRGYDRVVTIIETASGHSRPRTLRDPSAAQHASPFGLQVALRWFFARSLVRQQGLTREHIDRIPGKQTDRKTPLGELNWIFTAVTDTIAWNLLPRALFQRLFRQVHTLKGVLGVCEAGSMS